MRLRHQRRRMQLRHERIAEKEAQRNAQSDDRRDDPADERRAAYATPATTGVVDEYRVTFAHSFAESTIIIPNVVLQTGTHARRASAHVRPTSSRPAASVSPRLRAPAIRTASA